MTLVLDRLALMQGPILTLMNEGRTADEILAVLFNDGWSLIEATGAVAAALMAKGVDCLVKVDADCKVTLVYGKPPGRKAA